MKRREAFAVWIIVAANTADAQNAEFFGLGDLPGGFEASTGRGVSRDGNSAVGSSASGGFALGEPYLWRKSTGMQGLGFLEGGNDGYGTAISPEGRWVVGQSESYQGYVAFAWSEDTGMFALGDLPGGSAYSIPQAVSRNGRVVVGKGTVSWNGQDASEAFRWTEAHGMVGMGTLPTIDRKPSSTAHDISADGSVIVGGSSITGGSVAFRWAEETGMVALEPLSESYLANVAHAVSADGQWTAGEGFYKDDLGRSTGEAIMWDPLGNIIELGFLHEGNVQASEANDVALGGRAVVGTSSDGRSPKAFLWTPEDGMRSVEAILREDYGIDVVSMGWSLHHGYAITPDGRTIVGTGLNPNGRDEAWMVRLPVPAPSTLPPLALAALLAARRRR